MSGKLVEVIDSLQTYTYELSELEGENFSPEFKPDLTPAMMLELGVFGANYFQGEYAELPESWLDQAKISDHGHDSAMNFFEIDASQSRAVWLQKGWINENDPRGWFQWYCRYYRGRRLKDEDNRQISRWKQMKRHLAQIQRNCAKGDWSCRRRQRQALLHWAYDSRKI